MIFTPLLLSGAFLVEPESHRDLRGSFSRMFCCDEFSAKDLGTKWKQHNSSFNVKRGTLRGLHYQLPPFSEIKLIHCTKGAIWDVIVDLRENSPTYGYSHHQVLDDQNRSMLYIPKGFAHGYQTLTNNAEVYYLSSERYDEAYECGLIWNDPDVAIEWPLSASCQSPKDKNLPNLANIKPVKL